MNKAQCKICSAEFIGKKKMQRKWHIRKKQYEPSIHLLCETNIDMTINVKTKTILEHIEKNQYDIDTLIISKGFFDKRVEYDKEELRKPKVEEMIINEYNNRCYDYYNDYTKLHVFTR